VRQARSKEVGAGGEDVGERFSQPMQALRDGDAAVALAIAVRSLTRRERTGVRPASRVVRRSWWRRSAWWALHRFGDGLRIAVVVFVALEECSHILGGHQSGVVAEGF